MLTASRFDYFIYRCVNFYNQHVRNINAQWGFCAAQLQKNTANYLKNNIISHVA